MSRTVTLLILLPLLSLPAMAETPIATGHITAGTPHTAVASVGSLVAVDGVDSFLFDTPAAGTVITTTTVDHGAFGYDLDFYFYDADHAYIGSCATDAADEVCAVPEGAVLGEVAAYHGVDLDVSVVAL